MIEEGILEHKKEEQQKEQKYGYLAGSYREKVVYAILSEPEVLLRYFVGLGGTL